MNVEKVSLNKVKAINIAAVSSKLSASPAIPDIIGKENNLSVSMNLEALVGKLNIETSDTKENVMKTTLGSAFAKVIALAQETGSVSASNMEQLNAAKNYGDQLDVVNDELNKLETNSIEIDNGIEAKKKRVKKLQQEIAQIEKAMQAEGADVEALTKQLNEKKVELDIVQTELSSLQKEKAELTTKINTLKGTKSQLESKINEALSNIKDVNIIRMLAELLKIDVDDIIYMNDENKAERSENEEKWLDTHSPIRIIQDAINRHDTEMLDDITKSKEEKV